MMYATSFKETLTLHDEHIKAMLHYFLMLLILYVVQI